MTDGLLLRLLETLCLGRRGRRQAAREVAKLGKRGQQTSPVVIDGRKIAKTFWGKA
jgi:hypothetical protein